MIPLQGFAQNYAWGKIGSASAVSRLLDSPVSEEKPYAELWFGTHSSGPSKNSITQETLSDLLKSHPEYSNGHFTDGQLPYLLKVLSIRTALSIQAHPDKALAEKLHARDPVNYKDGNHKPEMTVALNDFEGLCGFRSYGDLCAQLQAVPELQGLVGPTLAPFLAAGADQVPLPLFECPVFEQRQKTKAMQRETFQVLFRRLMESPAEAVAAAVARLVARLRDSPEPLHRLAVRLNEQYPGDIGVFNIFLLNYITMKRGEAMFLAANEPHAYISGDVVEIMATSDNVVRAGLTPKFKDVETLVAMLTYNFGRPAQFPGTAAGGGRTDYRPPCAEFKLARFAVEAGVEVSVSPGPCLVLVLEGHLAFNGIESRPGAAFFVPASIVVSAKASSAAEFWIASTNDHRAAL